MEFRKQVTGIGIADIEVSAYILERKIGIAASAVGKIEDFMIQLFSRIVKGADA